MLLHVYSVYDKKADMFGPLFLSNNDETAKRDVQNLLQNPNSTLSQFPGDFDIMLLGNFNDSTGVLQPMDHPLLICNTLRLIEVDK